MKWPQFGIRTIFLVTFVVCLVAAILSQNGTIAQRILLAILFSNFLGAVVALMVTFVFKFPRDGSYRSDPDDETEFGDEENEPSEDQSA